MVSDITDQDFEQKSCKFLDLATNMYRTRLIRIDTLVNEIMHKPFDFTKKDSITLINEDSSHFASDENALAKRWAKWLKYKTLYAMVIYSADSEAASTEKHESILLKEPETRNKDILPCYRQPPRCCVRSPCCSACSL